MTSPNTTPPATPAENRLPSPNYAEFWERLRCLCALHGFSVTSGARTRAHNESVGGVDNSWHGLARGGMAADLAPDPGHPFWKVGAPALEAAAQDARRLGMDAVVYETHLHVEPTG